MKYLDPGGASCNGQGISPYTSNQWNICPEAWTVVLSSRCLSRFQVSEVSLGSPGAPAGSQEPRGEPGDPGLPGRPGTTIGDEGTELPWASG